MPSELGLHCLKAQDNSHPAVLVPAQAQIREVEVAVVTVMGTEARSESM